MAFPWLALGTFLVGLTAVLSIAYLWEYRPVAPMTPAAARAAIRYKLIDQIIDVRNDAEWANAGPRDLQAIHIPLKTLARNLPHTVPDRSTRLLFTCSTGRRAARAAAIAQDLGYTEVAYLIGGNIRELEKMPQPIVNA